MITLNRPSRRIGLPPGMPRAREPLFPPLRIRTLSMQVKPGLFPGQKGAGPADTVAALTDVVGRPPDAMRAARALMYRGTEAGFERAVRTAGAAGATVL